MSSSSETRIKVGPNTTAKLWASILFCSLYFVILEGHKRISIPINEHVDDISKV